MNLEDARVCAYWNHCFDMHLSYLGPRSCFLHPEFPQGAQFGASAVADGLLASIFFVYWYSKQHFSSTAPDENYNWETVTGRQPRSSEELLWRGRGQEAGDKMAPG